MRLAGKRQGEVLEPLERVTVLDCGPGSVTVTDGMGRTYFRRVAAPELYFTVGGSLGYHTITLVDDSGGVRDQLHFRVDAQTRIDDEGREFAQLLQTLFYTSVTQPGENSYVRYQGRVYHFFVCWLRDHVHTLKGMKYFAGRLKDALDLYSNTQQSSGMIWDNVYPRTREENWWDTQFSYDGFIQTVEDGTLEFKRIPVENDVEYLFVEGLYYTWKAVGDDRWLADTLDAACKALEYSVSSPYRWSSKYKLLKRGYTIDTWDFQTEEDSALSGMTMVIDREKTRFGIMFGDNTGYAMACRYLAEMLDHVGRAEEAERYRQREQEIRERLDRVSWNGRYFTHHVPENPEIKRNLGVDEKSQVALSNAYSLNRGITHEQCVAIIKTYQGLREQLPEGSPGEWYTIYPPFQNGFGGHSSLWQYMNAGVTPIVAGELAHGAFEHGFEDYGVDILRRLLELASRYGNRLHCVYTGANPQSPERSYRAVDIAAYANTDVVGEGAPGVAGWTGEGENDLHEMPVGYQHLAGIPFLIPDPITNKRRGCIGLSQREGYAKGVDLAVEGKARAIYFLHTCSQTGVSRVAGTITLQYADNSVFHQYVVRDQNVRGWWFPEDLAPEVGKVAWRGKNNVCPNIGVVAYGMNNPYPELDIERITLTAAKDGAFWAVLGVTLSDQKAYFGSNPISYGIPDSWGTGAVIYALVGGLAGVVDRGVCYSQVTLAPRWAAAAINKANVVVRYPDSLGYAAYRYHHNRDNKTIAIVASGGGERCSYHVLLPGEAWEVVEVQVNGERVEHSITHIEQAHYVDFVSGLCGAQEVTILYS